MSLAFIGENSSPNYIALSSDIVDNKIDGASMIGGTVLLTDVVGTGSWKILDFDLSLKDYVLPLSGGGGISSYTFPFDTPPTVPNAKDDEFNGTSLDAKWTNPISSASGLDLSLSFGNGMVIFKPNTAGSGSTGKHGIFGIRQNAPTGSFTITAKTYNGKNSGDDSLAGIFVARTANATAHVLGSQTSVPRPANYMGTASYSEVADSGGWDGLESYVFAGQPPQLTWYKIVWTSGAGTLDFYYSFDGALWKLLYQRTSISQPDRIGIGIYSNGGNITADHQIGCDWFRVTEP